MPCLRSRNSHERSVRQAPTAIKMGCAASGHPFDNFAVILWSQVAKCTAEGFVINTEIKAIVKSKQSVLQTRHTLRQGRVAEPT